MQINIEEELEKLHNNICLVGENYRQAKLEEIMNQIEAIINKDQLPSDIQLTDMTRKKPEKPKSQKNLYIAVALLEAFIIGFTIHQSIKKSSKYQNNSNYVQILYETLESNPNIDSKYLESMEKLRHFFMNTSVINYKIIDRKFATLEVEESDEIIVYENGSVVLARYLPWLNTIIIYPYAGGKVEDISHEMFHMIGYLTDYHYLNEGITELLNREFCKGDDLKYYRRQVNCVKILCELISPEVILEAYCSYDATPIIEALTSLCNSQEAAKLLLQEMECFCEKSNIEILTYEDIIRIRTSVFDFMVLIDQEGKIDKNLEQIQKYLEYIATPSMETDVEPILYWNNSHMNLGFTKRKVFSINTKSDIIYLGEMNGNTEKIKNYS